MSVEQLKMSKVIKDERCCWRNGNNIITSREHIFSSYFRISFKTFSFPRKIRAVIFGTWLIWMWRSSLLAEPFSGWPTTIHQMPQQISELTIGGIDRTHKNLFSPTLLGVHNKNIYHFFDRHIKSYMRHPSRRRDLRTTEKTFLHLHSNLSSDC